MDQSCANINSRFEKQLVDIGAVVETPITGLCVRANVELRISVSEISGCTTSCTSLCVLFGCTCDLDFTLTFILVLAYFC